MCYRNSDIVYFVRDWAVGVEFYLTRILMHKNEFEGFSAIVRGQVVF